MARTTGVGGSQYGPYDPDYTEEKKYESKSGWQYGYFGADGVFVTVTPDYGQNFSQGGKRIVFWNEALGKAIPYADLADGAPGATKHEQGIGRGAILYYLDTGEYPKEGKKYVDNFINYNGGKDVWKNYAPQVNSGLPSGIPVNNLLVGMPSETDEDGDVAYLDPLTGEYKVPDKVEEEDEGKGPYDKALNAYYKDLYSLAPGTGGAQMYDRLTDVYANQATVAGNLAEAQYQQQAMQQAEVVKQITDQVRGERMARLRSGMSESQIANQDMQMMMTNVDTLNQNASMLNQGRLEAAGAFSTAQDQAYMDYLNQSNARGQVAMAGYATDAGNVAYQVQQYMNNNPNVSYEEAQRIVTGYYTQNPKK